MNNTFKDYLHLPPNSGLDFNSSTLAILSLDF